MRRTVKIKLSLENRQYLEKTVQQFKKACQVTVNAGWNKHELKITKRNTLHEMVYKELREMTDLYLYSQILTCSNPFSSRSVLESPFLPVRS